MRRNLSGVVGEDEGLLSPPGFLKRLLLEVERDKKLKRVHLTRIEANILLPMNSYYISSYFGTLIGKNVSIFFYFS